MKARVKKLSLNQYKRVIVTSDIHADYDGFVGLLNQINFSNEDFMIIVGDILEKGKDSLKLLRKVMSLDNVFLVLGNNDTLFSDWKSGMVKPSDMLWYMNSRENSIFIEMANELNLEYKTEEDLILLEEKVFETYPNEIHYLNNCYHILDTENYTFVHAGLDPNQSLEEQEVDTCLSDQAFALCPHHFEKTVFVGHWPASNYRKNIINANPYFSENNTISIDGGNSMKSWQQINYLMIENNKIKSDAIDRCEKVRCLNQQEESKNPITLNYPNTKIEIKEEYEDTSLCYIPFLNEERMIKNDRIYVYKRETYCYDFTTYHLEINENEIVSYCEKIQDGILIKRNGIVGNYKGRYEKM